MSNSSRRSFLKSTSLAVAASSALPRFGSSLSVNPAGHSILEEFGYSDVQLHSELHESQLRNAHSVLMELSEDSLLKPFRAMAGMPSPGEDLGGWYSYKPDYNFRKDDAGLAPGATFGQWVSALSRHYAITADTATREKVLRLNRLYAGTISGDYYEKSRFPAYSYDKLVCGLIDSRQFVRDPDTLAILDRTTKVALPHLPGGAISRGKVWRARTDESFTWDESYTLPENCFLAYERGAGPQYKEIAKQYLDESFFGPLAEGRDNFEGLHAYSHVNAFCSAMQAYFTLGSGRHLQTALHGFDRLQAQSFATGGWGPDELLHAAGSDELAASLANTHNSFETPCGAYAHLKLTRQLLRATGDSRFGDSMERVTYNTVLGAKPLQADGRAFYYSDYNFDARKVYSTHRWPCCSGTLPQVAADYRICVYFRDEAGIYVNLFVPSTLKWFQDGAPFALELATEYPLGPEIRMELRCDRSREFALRVRIPAWADEATVSVNGKRQSSSCEPGKFWSIRRTWKSGDRIELHLPTKNRLEAINEMHPDTVALLNGPLVLFGVDGKDKIVTRTQLLAAQQVKSGEWRTVADSGPMTLRPFFSIGDESYSTYFRLDS